MQMAEAFRLGYPQDTRLTESNMSANHREKRTVKNIAAKGV